MIQNINVRFQSELTLGTDISSYFLISVNVYDFFYQINVACHFGSNLNSSHHNGKWHKSKHPMLQN